MGLAAPGSASFRRHVLNGLLVEVREAHADGPRALLSSKLWNLEPIEKSTSTDPDRTGFGRYRESHSAG